MWTFAIKREIFFDSCRSRFSKKRPHFSHSCRLFIWFQFHSVCEKSFETFAVVSSVGLKVKILKISFDFSYFETTKELKVWDVRSLRKFWLRTMKKLQFKLNMKSRKSLKYEENEVYHLPSCWVSHHHHFSFYTSSFLLHSSPLKHFMYCARFHQKRNKMEREGTFNKKNDNHKTYSTIFLSSHSMRCAFIKCAFIIEK